MKKISTFCIALKVSGIHLGVIGVIVLYSLLNGCLKPEPNNEVVMFVELAPMGPAMGGGAETTPPEEVEEQEMVEEPTPPEEIEEQEIEEEPEVVEEPIPEDPTPEVIEPTLKPVEPTPEPVEPKPKPVEPTPEPPKNTWKSTPVEAIKVSDERVKATPSPSPKPVQKIDVGKILESGSSSGPVGTPSDFAAYESRVTALFQRAWNSYKPSSGGPAWIRISFSSNGTITSRRMQKSSGDAAYDAAAQRAANSISSLPKPPSGYGKTYLDIKFELKN